VKTGVNADGNVLLNVRFRGKADIVPTCLHVMRHDGCSYLPELLRNTRLREPFIFCWWSAQL
jgi:hypothetical protein